MSEGGERQSSWAERVADLKPQTVYGRAAVAYGLARFAAWSVREGYWDFASSAVRSLTDFAARSGLDLIFPKPMVQCNMCGWTGRSFYRNTGPGYDEDNSICPGCLCSDRYRSLFEYMQHCTSVFMSGSRIIEVAPLRSLQKIFLGIPGLNYTSFDIERRAMERGDITSMRYGDDSVDWFICFHVLEHLPDEAAALDEIHRVLRPDGAALFQVPIDWDAAVTREYEAPDPRDVEHVRRHGRDFGSRIAEHGFEVQQINLPDHFGRERMRKAGLSTEPIFLARAIK